MNEEDRAFWYWYGYRSGRAAALRLLLLVVTCLVLGVWLTRCAAGQGCPGGTCPLPNYGAGVYQRPAQPPAYTPAYTARVDPAQYVQISAPDAADPRAQYVASGSIVDVYGLPMVLTAAHELRGSSGPCAITLADGRRIAARPDQIDADADLALLAFDQDPGVRPLTVAPDEPTALMTVCGYGPGRFAARRMPWLTSVHLAHDGWACLAGSTQQGDSGGAIVNAAGRVVGVCWGSRDGRVYWTGGGPLRRLLARIRARRSPHVAADARRRTPPATRPADAGWQPAGKIIGEQLADVRARGGPTGPAIPPPTDDPAIVERLQDNLEAIRKLRETKQDRGNYVTGETLAESLIHYPERGELPKLVKSLAGTAGAVAARAAPDLVDWLGVGGALGSGALAPYLLWLLGRAGVRAVSRRGPSKGNAQTVAGQGGPATGEFPGGRNRPPDTPQERVQRGGG